MTLTDVLKTDHGRAHFERIKLRCSLEKQARASELLKGCGNNKEKPTVCRDKTPGLKSASKDAKENTTLKWNRKTPTLSSRWYIHCSEKSRSHLISKTQLDHVLS